MRLTLALFLTVIGCCPQLPAAWPTASSVPQPQRRETWTADIRSREVPVQDSPPARNEQPFDSGSAPEAAPRAYELTLELRNAAGVLVGAYDLGVAGPSCEVHRNAAPHALLSARCWENIAGVPYVHHDVDVIGNEVVVTTRSGECGWSEDSERRVLALPAGVQLRAADLP